MLCNANHVFFSVAKAGPEAKHLKSELLVELFSYTKAMTQNRVFPHGAPWNGQRC